MVRIFKRAAHTAWLVCTLALSPSVWAGWTSGDLDVLKQEFVNGIASQFQTMEYPWAFLDQSSCFEPKHTCSGTNPDSPYGYVNFDNKGLASHLGQTDALVLIMETPPAMRYFGITPYLHTRYYQSLPGKPDESAFVTVFESLGDTVNNSNIRTVGSSEPGQNAFTQLSVFVVTADRVSYGQIWNQFRNLGFPAYAINQIALPLTAVPLKMGSALTTDTFGVLLRVAYPDNAWALQDYIARAPVRAMVLSPNQWRPTYPLPTPESKTPGSGSTEPIELRGARDQLYAELAARYGRDYDIVEADFKLKHSINYVCVDLATNCGGDNPDALYATDVQAYIPEQRADKILIVGVNHVLTGKARYLSHSIVNTDHLAGVAAANDAWLEGSALRMAGIKDANDSRYPLYSQLYAYTISYDCSGEVVCQNVPEPTEESKIGVAFGEKLNITSRYYVDPATGTRPSGSELYQHRTFLLKRKTSAN